MWIYFYRDGAHWTLDSNNVSDLPLHLAYIANFAGGTRFWPENPIFSGVKLHYPFGMDLFTALFVKTGVSFETALPVIGVIFSLFLWRALQEWGRGFAVGAFLFSGALIWSFLLPPETANETSGYFAWENIPLALLIPQRGFLFAFPAGLWLLIRWRRRFLQNEFLSKTMFEGLLWGILPLFHLHTFLFLSAVFGIWSLAAKKLREAAAILGWAFLPAAPAVFVLTDFFRLGSLIWLAPGWLIENGNVLSFLGMNFGVYPLLLLWTVGWAARAKRKDLLLLLLHGLGFFLLLFFVMFSPWKWDNIKMMVWSYLLLLPAMGECLFAHKRPLVRLGLCLLLFFPGMMAAARAAGSQNQGVELFRDEEKDFVCFDLKSVSPQARVAAAPAYNHPVALCGRLLILGYPGQLWSHGIPYKETESRLRDLMLGRGGWRERARELHAEYLFWGAREDRAYPNSARPWEKISVKIAESPWGKLYRL